MAISNTAVLCDVTRRMQRHTCRSFAPSCLQMSQGAVAGLPLRTHLNRAPSVRLRKPCVNLFNLQPLQMEAQVLTLICPCLRQCSVEHFIGAHCATEELRAGPCGEGADTADQIGT